MNEKIGGSQHIPQSTKDFRKWCESLNLIDIPCNNGNFTWNNK